MKFLANQCLTIIAFPDVEYKTIRINDFLSSDCHINISLSDNVSISIQKLSLKAKLFRGLADTTRLSILEALRDGEKTTSEIVKETTHNQSNVSNHLACLLDCGLVKNRREGKNIYYKLNNDKSAKIA